MQSSKKTALVSRRQFLAVSAMGSAAAAIGCSPGKHAGWEFLSEGQARALTVLCDQISPADDFPSASQAGVLTYIDNQLVRFYRRHQEAYRDGLAQAATLSATRFGKPLEQVVAARDTAVEGFRRASAERTTVPAAGCLSSREVWQPETRMVMVRAALDASIAGVR